MAVAVAPPDVVPLDIHMPIVDGDVSGLAGRHGDGKPRLDAFDYVTKPFDVLYLARVIEAAVAHRG